MCKDNLGKCGCGCNKCGSSSATATTQKATTTPTESSALVPSGYGKKSDSYVTSTSYYDSDYSKKSPTAVAPVKVTAVVKPRKAVQEQIIVPLVEVVPNEGEKAINDWAPVAMGLGLLLFGAAVKSISNRNKS